MANFFCDSRHKEGRVCSCPSVSPRLAAIRGGVTVIWQLTQPVFTKIAPPELRVRYDEVIFVGVDSRKPRKTRLVVQFVGMYARTSAVIITLTAAAPWSSPTFRALAKYSRCFKNGVDTDCQEAEQRGMREFFTTDVRKPSEKHRGSPPIEASPGGRDAAECVSMGTKKISPFCIRIVLRLFRKLCSVERQRRGWGMNEKVAVCRNPGDLTHRHNVVGRSCREGQAAIGTSVLIKDGDQCR